MKVIFYGNRYGNFVDKLIRFKTATWKQRFDGSWRDLPSHVELLFSDAIMFSASQYENSTRFKKCNIKYGAWKICNIDITIDKEYKIRKWCASHDGKKYDYLGILGFLLGNRDDSNKWFCSEVCTEALKSIGMFSGIDSAKISPSMLYEMLNNKKDR